ncbi:MAG TPA: hypothetical protein ENN35_06040 [Deltaproteobacteria bacterium]|nr:hypothetical protein [Deltaproteobacteria bacterium]
MLLQLDLFRAILYYSSLLFLYVYTAPRENRAYSRLNRRHSIREVVNMDLKKSVTEENLQKALTLELHAHFGYITAARAARNAGYDLVSDIFYQTALNELEHATHEFNFLGGDKDVVENLVTAIEHENEATAFYRASSLQAEKEGFHDIAEFFTRIGIVEEGHSAKFREILHDLENNIPLKGRTVKHSALTMAELMLPAQANPAGFVHGGELMKMMDNAAGVAAARHSHTNVVTVLVNDIHFIHPVMVGSLVLINAHITYVRRSSMEVRVEVETEHISEEKRVKALTAYYTMVAVDEQGRPVEVPPLTVYTEEEIRLFKEGQERYEARKQQQK